jgi:hypothetical protein
MTVNDQSNWGNPKMMKVRNVSLLVVAAAVVVFAGSLVPAAVMQNQKPGAIVQPHFPSTDSTPLYTQLDGDVGNGAPDQDFEAAYDAYSSEGADDFFVTGGGWEIGGLNTPGISGGGSITVNLTFYEDNGGGLPVDTPSCELLGLTDYTDTAGDLSINFSDNKCVLADGHYWVAQEVRQDFLAAGQHFWSNSAVLHNSQSVWRNPADGFGTTCTDWDQQTDCGVGGGTNPDFQFELLESKVGGPAGTPAVGPFGMLMTVLALGGGSAYVLARRRRA